MIPFISAIFLMDSFMNEGSFLFPSKGDKKGASVSVNIEFSFILFASFLKVLFFTIEAGIENE